MKEGIVNEIIIENPMELRRLVSELLDQTEGEEGKFVLSHEGEIIKISERLDIILHPFSLELNSRKILDKIYMITKQDIQNTELYLEQCNLLQTMYDFFNKVVEKSDYNLEFDCEVDMKQILKLVNIRLEEQCEGLLEKIIEYIKVYHQVFKYEIFVFLHLKSYFDKGEIEQIYKYASYRKISLILFESVQYFDNDLHENRVIIDKDRCEIY